MGILKDWFNGADYHDVKKRNEFLDLVKNLIPSAYLLPYKDVREIVVAEKNVNDSNIILTITKKYFQDTDLEINKLSSREKINRLSRIDISGELLIPKNAEFSVGGECYIPKYKLILAQKNNSNTLYENTILINYKHDRKELLIALQNLIDEYSKSNVFLVLNKKQGVADNFNPLITKKQENKKFIELNNVLKALSNQKMDELASIIKPSSNLSREEILRQAKRYVVFKDLHLTDIELKELDIQNYRSIESRLAVLNKSKFFQESIKIGLVFLMDTNDKNRLYDSKLKIDDESFFTILYLFCISLHHTRSFSLCEPYIELLQKLMIAYPRQGSCLPVDIIDRISADCHGSSYRNEDYEF